MDYVTATVLYRKLPSFGMQLSDLEASVAELDDSNTRLESQLAAAQAHLSEQEAQAVEQARQHQEALAAFEKEAATHAQLLQESRAMRSAVHDKDTHVAALKVPADITARPLLPREFGPALKYHMCTIPAGHC